MILYSSVDDIPQPIQTNYSVELNNDSQKCSHLNSRRQNYYYEAFEINVHTSGYYFISTTSNFSTSGYLYKHYFDPYNPEQNLLYKTNRGSSVEHFKTIYLELDIMYTLVITSSIDVENAQGLVLVTIYGTDKIFMNKIGKNY